MDLRHRAPKRPPGAARQWRVWAREAGDLAAKALPMVAAGCVRSLTSILQVQALAHVGSRALAGYSLALVVVNLTGYPFMYGLGGALESLCSQAFTGARGRKHIGVYVQHAIWLFLAANVLVTLLWLFPGPLLRVLAPPGRRDVAQCARVLLAFECTFFPAVVVQTCLKRFLLAQGLMRPTVLFELAGLAAMFLSLRLLVWTPATAVGFAGAPASAAVAYAAVLLANAVYIACSPCRAEWGPFTMAGFAQNARHIVRLGVPCGISGVASYGFSDLATVGVAMLGPEALAVQAVLNSSKSAFSRTGSYLGMVVSNRVGNLLGARDPAGAALVAWISVAMTAAASALVAALMFALRRQFASFIAGGRALEAGLLPLLPLLVVVVVFDMLSNVLTGVLRGQGRQGVAAAIRIAALYVLGVPLAYALCFPLGLGLRGLWIGLAAGFVAIAVAEAYLVFSSDWPAEARRAIERVRGSDSPAPALLPQESSPLLRPHQLC
ncbi:hypothetical protein H4R18_004954 [Coemansia javaensis]|uniref:Multidrug and toxic compound extrusion protein n=1 Tax=Coemansia javaensis TaxID=2761396 RepID=A0A9W8H4N0_9FUNG|nr:hypothetical protein H4R18_004954 [Coemansia javaensis]